jgi:hypothetical protein
VAAELVGRFTVWGVEMFKAGLKQDFLDEMYKAYARNPSEQGFQDFLNTQSVLGGYAVGGREYIMKLREQFAAAGIRLTEAQIMEKLRAYVKKTHRMKLFAKRVDRFEKWMQQNMVSLRPGDDYMDIWKLKRDNPGEFYRLMSILLSHHDRILEQLKKDGIHNAGDVAKLVLKMLYNGATQEEIEAFLQKIYAAQDKQYKKARKGKKAKGPKSAKNCRPKVKKSRNAKLTRAKVPQGGPKEINKAQLITGFGGGFQEERVDHPCDPSIKSGPFNILVGGKLEAWIKGIPPIKPRWSQGNSNSGLTVIYEPWLGGGEYGPGQRLLAISGDLKTGEAKATADLPGPGLLTAWVSQARGAGPLTGSCFKQSFQAKLTLTEVALHGPLRAGAELFTDDVIRTGPGGHSVISVPCRGDMLLGPGSQAGVKDGGSSFNLLNGLLRGVSRPGQTAPEVTAGPYRIIPQGTEFQVQHTAKTTRVRVLAGEVTVQGAPAGAVQVAAGNELSLPEGKITLLKPGQDDGGMVDGIPLARMLLDDSTPEPYGTYPARLQNGELEGGWRLIDPKNDCKLSGEGRAFTLTVPPENELWNHRADGPRLLHKASGDFDLEADLKMTCAGQHLAITEFAIMAPGRHLGYLAKQMALESPGDDLRLLGGGWYRYENRNRLPIWDRKLAEGWDPKEGRVRFRLSRRQDWFITQWSSDGKVWNLAGIQEIKTPQTLWTGMTVKRMAYDGKRGQASINRFGSLVLKTSAQGGLPMPKWLSQQTDGSISAQGETWTFKHDPARMGTLRQTLSSPLEGDFDAVVKVDIGSASAQAGQGWLAGIELLGEPEKDRTYMVLSDHSGHKGRYFTDLRVKGQWGDHQYHSTQQKKGRLRLQRLGQAWSVHIIIWMGPGCGWTSSSANWMDHYIWV